MLFSREGPQFGRRAALAAAESGPQKHDVRQQIFNGCWYETEDEAREIGRRYAELLRAKYPDWKFGQEVMDASLRIVEVSFDKSPCNLQLRLVRDEHEGHSMWRFSISLGWQVHAKEWLAWQNMSATQQAAAKTTDRELLLKESDVRGL